jgi:hypothetical protein
MPGNCIGAAQATLQMSPLNAAAIERLVRVVAPSSSVGLITEFSNLEKTVSVRRAPAYDHVCRHVPGVGNRLRGAVAQFTT